MQGNLSWQAAHDVEPATYAMALRVWKQEELSPEQAQHRLRQSVFQAVRDFSTQHGARPANDVLDIGCSVGVSTRYLANEFPTSSVTGLDLSAYFLAVAELRERQSQANAAADSQGVEEMMA